MRVIEIPTDFKVLDCAVCQIDFAVTESFYNRRKEDHKTFYCPAGHSNFFKAKTDKDLLLEENKLLKEKLKRKRK